MAISLVVAFTTALFLSYAINRTIVHVRNTKKKLDSEKSRKNVLPESYGPKSFLNHIKDELPRGIGLIYEVNTRIYKSVGYIHWPSDLTGDFLVDINVIDPISDEIVGSITLNERTDGKIATEKILIAVRSALRTMESKKMSGQTEIIS